MSCRRFKDITKSIHLTDDPPPKFTDPFHEVRILIQRWNENMTNLFVPSWLSCLDESMSVWFSKKTCPGWVYVPRKPHPFGNEWHTLSCANSKIIYQVELVEGKDHPKDLGDPEFHKISSPTTGLLLRLCKTIFGRGMVIVMDSGFCVLKALLELKKRGVMPL